MLFIEKHKRNNKTYFYLTKKIKIKGKWTKIRKYIGNIKPILSPEELLKTHIKYFTTKEIELKKDLIKELSTHTFHPSLAEKIEFMNTYLTNKALAENQFNKLYSEFSKKFVYNSNKIEGSKIPEEVIREILETRKTKYKNMNEIKEVLNSEKAMNYLLNEFTFSINSIKKLYLILTKDLFRESGTPYPKTFKKHKVVVNNNETVPPENVKESLNSLIKWYKSGKNTLHPLILAFEFHLRYEFIHPFEDANGRTGRLILNKILINNNYLPIIIFNENRRAYFNAISKAIYSDQKKKYYDFMLKQTYKTYKHYKKILK